MSRPIKTRTYNNFLRGMKIVVAKGYTEQEVEQIVKMQFDNLERTKNGMSLQWWLDKIAPRN